MKTIFLGGKPKNNSSNKSNSQSNSSSRSKDKIDTELDELKAKYLGNNEF